MVQSNPFYQVIRRKESGVADLFFLYITTYLDSSDYCEDGYEITFNGADGLLWAIAKVKRVGTPLHLVKAVTHQIPLEDIDLEAVEEIFIEIKEGETTLMGLTSVYPDETETIVKPISSNIEVTTGKHADTNSSFKEPYKKILSDGNRIIDIVIRPEVSQYITQKVFYGTNRKPTGSSQSADAYGPDRTPKENPEYGVCEVSIPKEHVEGKIERPSWLRGLFCEPSPEDHMTILSLTKQEEDDFLKKLKSSFSTGETEKQMLLFVHGYNVDFEESILRTAQLAYDLGFQGPAVNYSWPSRGKLLGYMADETSVEASIGYFKQFLLTLLQHSGVSRLHIIAHSMGNRLVAGTMKELAAMNAGFQSIIRHVVLAAPDIDVSVFKEQVVPAFKGIHRVTLYASSKDRALQTSMNMRAQYPRAGQSGENICVVNGVDTIDASTVNTAWLGHGYFAETKALIDDLHMLITNDLPPSRRNLRKVRITPHSYWAFPRTQ